MARRKKTATYWNSLFDLAQKMKKKRTRKYVKYGTNSNRIKQYTKPLTPLGQGLQDSLTIASKWNSQPHPPKVYVGGYRIHHGLAGALLTIYGLITENQYAIGFGAGLALDDISDMPNWLNFERPDINTLGLNQYNSNTGLDQFYNNNSGFV